MGGGGGVLCHMVLYGTGFSVGQAGQLGFGSHPLPAHSSSRQRVIIVDQITPRLKTYEDSTFVQRNQCAVGKHKVYVLKLQKEEVTG